MATIWKKIDNYDQSTDVFMSIQNNSLVPYSKVTIQFTTAAAPEEGKGFVLTGPNQWSQRVPAHTNVFYKEEDGGIITWWSRAIEKLVNYDIPTQEETVTSLKTKSVICPEGSFITIQNTGKTPVYYNMLGKANFVLTESQAVSYTFAKDNVINFKSDGTGILTYLIAQSPNVTMLSEETQKKLDDLIAKVDGLLEHAATKEELDVVKRRTYFGQWSPFLNTTGKSGTKIISDVFVKDATYHSEFLQDKNIVDIKAEIEITRNTEQKKNVTEKATLSASIITQQSGDDLTVSNFYCDNSWIQQNIKSIEFYRDQTNGQVKLTINFKSQIEAYTILVSLRADNVKFVKSTIGEFLSEKIGVYLIDKDNADIHFTDEPFYLGMLKSWDYSLETSVKSYSDITKSDSTSNSKYIQKISCGNGNDTSNITYAENTNGNDAIITVSIPAMIGANKVVGLNIKPKNVKSKVYSYMDLITMSNGQQTKQLNGNNTDFIIPLYRHTLHGYQYISNELSKLTTDNATEFYVEIVYS